MASHGGVVFRVGEDLFFLPAGIAIKVLPMPDVARVPGAPEALVGVALVDGDTVPVVAIGPSRAAMLVCAHLGERVALVGLSVVATGLFEVAISDGAEHLICEGARARFFDLSAVVSQMRTGRWAV